MDTWEYRRFGIDFGPVTEQRMQQLAAQGFFTPDDELRAAPSEPWAPFAVHAERLGLVKVGARIGAPLPVPSSEHLVSTLPPAHVMGPEHRRRLPPGVRFDHAGRPVLRPVSYGARVLAHLLDVVAFAVVAFVAIMVLVLLGLPEGALEVLAFLAFPAFQTACHATRRGQTPGKWVMGIRVCDATTGGPITVSVSLVRAATLVLLSLACCIPAVLSMLWPLWDARRQTLHDKAAGTLVVAAR